jgi:hypothetical protein
MGESMYKLPVYYELVIYTEELNKFKSSDTKRIDRSVRILIRSSMKASRSRASNKRGQQKLMVDFRKESKSGTI